MDRLSFGSLVFTFTYEFSKFERKLSSRAGLYSGQPRVLTILKFNQGSTLSELSELTGIGMPSLSVSVRNMEKSGLLWREISGSDGRVQKIYLTEDGLARAQHFHDEIDAFYGRVMAELGPEGCERIVDSLTYMAGKFSAGAAELQNQER